MERQNLKNDFNICLALVGSFVVLGIFHEVSHNKRKVVKRNYGRLEFEMSAKIASENQHFVLHEYWPDNCCLCNKEFEITALKLKIERLEKELEESKLGGLTDVQFP